MSTAATAQHAALGLVAAQQSGHTRHPDARWFPAAGLGLFVHWGIAAVHGNLDLSWGMIANTPWDSSQQNANKLPPNQYWDLARKFQPRHYCPLTWLRAARAAGFQYAVLTAMHHDGYTLWPSAHSELGVHSHLAGRDLVGPFVEACRTVGLKVGLYYSPPDWYQDREYLSFNYPTLNKEPAGGVLLDANHQPSAKRPIPAEHRSKTREIWLARVEELLTRYGPIDLLWFDGGNWDNAIRDRARELQPHLVINSRSCDGDYGSSECSLPHQPTTGWFETCHCWQESAVTNSSGQATDFWGYMATRRYKSSSWMLEHLSQLRSMNANFLVNVSPDADGLLPEVVYQRLHEVAGWMHHSGDSVLQAKGATALYHANLPVTTDGLRTYLHFLPAFSGTAELQHHRAPSRAFLLQNGQSVPHSFCEGTLRVTVPGCVRSNLVDVVAVE